MIVNQDQLFQSALNSLSQPICICDKDGKVLFMNSAASSLTGWKDYGGFVDMSIKPGKMEIKGRSFPCTLHQINYGDGSAFVAELERPYEDKSEVDRGR